MEFAGTGTRLFIEVDEGRLTLSLANAVDTACRRDALMRVIARCDPMRAQGLALHAFATRSQLVVSCVFPRDTSTRDWLAGHRSMRRLLDAHDGVTA
ncbi:secretion protein [Burkholderia sp. Nafp2/4-1b]|nr:secretion protein [Burkholderia sp. Nafp2/4-1b]